MSRVLYLILVLISVILPACGVATTEQPDSSAPEVVADLIALGDPVGTCPVQVMEREENGVYRIVAVGDDGTEHVLPCTGGQSGRTDDCEAATRQRDGICYDSPKVVSHTLCKGSYPLANIRDMVPFTYESFGFSDGSGTTTTELGGELYEREKANADQFMWNDAGSTYLRFHVVGGQLQIIRGQHYSELEPARGVTSAYACSVTE